MRRVFITLRVKDGDVYERAYEVESMTIPGMVADIFSLANWPEEFTATVQCNTAIGSVEKTTRGFRP